MYHALNVLLPLNLFPFSFFLLFFPFSVSSPISLAFILFGRLKLRLSKDKEWTRPKEREKEKKGEEREHNRGEKWNNGTQDWEESREIRLRL